MTRLMGLHLFNVVLEFILHDYFLSAQLGRIVKKRKFFLMLVLGMGL